MSGEKGFLPRTAKMRLHPKTITTSKEGKIYFKPLPKHRAYPFIGLPLPEAGRVTAARVGNPVRIATILRDRADSIA